jgi:hypothetical protein
MFKMSIWTLRSQLAALEGLNDKLNNDLVEILAIKHLLKSYDENTEVFIYSHTLFGGYINVYAQFDSWTRLYFFDEKHNLFGIQKLKK